VPVKLLSIGMIAHLGAFDLLKQEDAKYE